MHYSKMDSASNHLIKFSKRPIFFCAGVLFTHDLTIFGHFVNITKTQKPFFRLNPDSKLTRNVYYFFPIILQYKYNEKKHLRHFFQIFSELHFMTLSRYRKKKNKNKKAPEEASTDNFSQLMFSGVTEIGNEK